jgi:hypothetical protein
MKRPLAWALLLPLLIPSAVRGDGLSAGNWKITTLTINGANEVSNWIIKIDTEGDKTTATLAASTPGYPSPSLKSFVLKGDHVRVVLAASVFEQTFDGRIAKDGKKVVGTFGPEGSAMPAWMTPTDETSLNPKKGGTPADSAVAAGVAALFKLRVAKKGTPDADLTEWADTASKDAVQYGPAWQLRANVDIAMGLLKFKKVADLAIKYAEQAEKVLEPNAAPALRIKVLETVGMSAKAAGNAERSKQALGEVAKLDAALDKEYIAQGLPFKLDNYAGRKADSKRAVVLELFTGAQCPPCVAADLAFDGLQKSYKPSELVLIQYHEHIPGPDPLTNTDSQARWKHYIDAFGKDNVKLGGVPTAILNGKTSKVGGGPLQFAGKTYAGYRDMIDPLLETPAGCQLKATATRSGDKIDIQADVAALENSGSDKKLRFVLVEEVVHYGGGNKIRMHHHVVRAMPGGVDGTSIREKDGQFKASVDIGELRKSLTTYLDTFVANNGPFPRAIRPMDMRNLRVIALVQDDATNEILQAVQVEVGEP